MNDFLEGIGPTEAERAENYRKLQMMSCEERTKLILHGPDDVVLEWSDEYANQLDMWFATPEKGVQYTIMMDRWGLYCAGPILGCRQKQVFQQFKGIPTLERAKEICTNHYNQVMR